MLQGRTVALAEFRQIEELAQMLEKEGASVLRCPLLSILDHPDQGPVIRWLQSLVGGEFTHVILLTGEGLRRLLAYAEHAQFDKASPSGGFDRQAVIAALGRIELITRGPKPGKALKEIGLSPTTVAAAPTTDGVIATLRQMNLRGARVGVQLYSDSNPPLMEFLASAGVQAYAVTPYIYAPATDAERVADLIRQLAGGRVDVLVFTSSPQVDRLFDVASEKGLDELLRQGLTRAKIAAVGPVLESTLRERGVRVDIAPEQGFVMKNLVQHIKRALADSA